MNYHNLTLTPLTNIGNTLWTRLIIIRHLNSVGREGGNDIFAPPPCIRPVINLYYLLKRIN